MTDSQTPPQDIETESAVLGAMMRDAGAVIEVRGILKASHFYSPKHAKIYRAIETLDDRNDPIDLATVKAELESQGLLEKLGGITALTDIADVMTSAYAEAHAKVIRDKAALRRIIITANEISQQCYTAPGDVQELIANVQEKFTAVGGAFTSNGTREIEGINMADVEAQEVEWLWKPFLPKGKITTLEGPPGMGKTTIAMQLAAIISRGWGFPDDNGVPGEQRAPADVIIMNAEDGLADTIKPRLIQADADCDRITAIDTFKSKGKKAERAVALQDVLAIEAVVVEKHAALLIVDPLQAYLGGKVDMHRAEDTRPVLKDLGKMAERTGCSILLIRHFRKSGGSKEDQGGGSIDIYAASRSVIMVTEDLDTENRYLMAHSKCNIAQRAKTRAYTLTDGFFWAGTSDKTADDLSTANAKNPGGQAKIEEATAFLKRVLATGKLTFSEIEKRAGEEKIAMGTIKRAKRALGVVSERVGSISCWGLPEEPTTEETATVEPTQTNEFPPIICE